MRPLALTLGEPAGIGPEIVVKTWSALRQQGPAFVVVGDAELLKAAPGAPNAPVRPVASPAEAQAVFAEGLPVIDIPLPVAVVAGKPVAAAGPSVVRWIETAVGLCLSGGVGALVTAPIAKSSLYQAGFAFPGHTEFLGELTAATRHDGARGPIMMLAAADLRVSLVTIHEPLAKVPSLITVERVVNAGLVTAQALARDFGVTAPRLAVMGLNPHAGESGSIGGEEKAIIGPAVRALQDLGVGATGPHPADSMFHPDARARYDAALCMYHDQALIPVKMLDFWGGVNITLGLPIVRTSPDHGVGFDIAGRGLARADSLISAVRLAEAMAHRRNG